MNCPVVIIHKGSPDYLKWSLKQAKLYNESIFLIGDESNIHYKKKFHYEQIAALRSPLSVEFSSLYEHMSFHSYNFEFICLERWFILLEFMKIWSIEYLFHMDSDVMLYRPLDNLIKPLTEKFQAGYLIPEQEYNDKKWSASGHTSFWTRSGLENFCHFILDQYTTGKEELREKWAWHQKKKKPGGVCDMSLLYLFYFKNNTAIYNLADLLHDESTFDTNINSSNNLYKNEYCTKTNFIGDSMKKMFFLGNIPYCFHLHLKKNIAFNSLHFQGKAKNYMFLFYQGKKSFINWISHLKFTFMPLIFELIKNRIAILFNKD